MGQAGKRGTEESIGTRHETSLHRDLKFSYAGPDGRTEAELDGYVADGISAKGEIIEIQTGHFGAIVKKARKLAAQGKLKIIFPVIVNKYIEVFDANGKRKYRRKSPRKGNRWDIFYELVFAPELPLIRGLTIELALVDAAEQRVEDGKGSWRRGGKSIRDRALLAVHERIPLKKPADYLCFLPFDAEHRFTAAELGHKAGICANLAGKTVYVLNKLGLIEKTGKKGRALVYRRCPKKDSKKPQTTT